MDGSFINASGPIATIKNYPNEVIVKKEDQDGTALTGATFGLFSDDGERIKTAVSDSEGMIRFSMINPGQYVMKETIPPDGYLPSKETYRFSMDKDFKNSAEPSMTFVNRLKRIRCMKKDTSGRFISGVEFRLINSRTGEVVETVISNEKGEFVFTRFDYGDWIIRETQAPEGFNRMDDITLHVDENWTEPEPIICINIPNHYEFIKTDWRGNPLPGVKFALEDADGDFICDLTSGDDGVVRIVDLSPGAYVIRETEALEGYTRVDETIQVVINEDYVIPEEIPRLVNYTGIQTGFAYVMTPIMWSGVELVICAVAMMIWHNATKRRSKRRR